MSDHTYTTELGDIGPGVIFMMVNYPGVYIRVKARDLQICFPGSFNPEKQRDFNDDGHHVPIVELANGHLFYMSKIKPCMVYPGQSLRNE